MRPNYERMLVSVGPRALVFCRGATNAVGAKSHFRRFPTQATERAKADVRRLDLELNLDEVGLARPALRDRLSQLYRCALQNQITAIPFGNDAGVTPCGVHEIG